jgi:hypothetical protein
MNGILERIRMLPNRWQRWKRRIRTAMLTLLIVVGIPVGVHFYLPWSANRNFQKALAEADHLDPGWRLADLEKSRAAVADSENSALRVLGIKKRMPSLWPNTPPTSLGRERFFRETEPVPEAGLEDVIRHLLPEMQIPPETIPLLQRALRQMASVLADARAMSQWPRGRYPIEHTQHPRDTTKVSNDAIIVARLLWADAILAAQEKRFDQAYASGLAILNTARSIGDEPIMESQSMRASMDNLAIRTMERILAQGPVSAAILDSTQKLLEDEASQPLLLTAFRAERAATHRHMLAVQAGRWKYSLRFYHGRFENKLPISWNRYIDMVIVRRTQPDYFRLMSALVEAAKLPDTEQLSQIRELESQARQLPIEFESWFQSTAGTAYLFLRNKAYLRCAVAGLAVERYRLIHGDWPQSLESMVSDLLFQAPIDPFDGKPLRFRRLEDGVMIYSIGPDGEDDGGRLNREDYQPMGTDLGFQLWDVALRGQPWRPPPKQAEDDSTEPDI